MSLARLGAEVYEWCERTGWEPAPERTFGDEIALIHTEVSEAMEAYRRWGMADATPAPTELVPVPKPEGVASEFGDILIRLVHYAHVHEIDLEREVIRKMAYNQTRKWKHGDKLL